MRTCFQSRWRLFQGSTNLTYGRYVKCPEGTPHYPGFHNLGSRDWTSDERDPWPDLGEYEGAREYYNGAAPPQYPSAITLGNAECIQLGETQAPADRPFYNGFDARCFLTPALVSPPPPPRIDVSQRATMSTLADIQELLYTDAAAAATMLLAYLGEGATVSFVADSPTSVIPGSLIGVSPTQTVVMVSGTTDQQQFAFQFLYFLTGPVDFGNMSTNVQYWAAANAINNRATLAGVDLTKPITLVGHSYGGAAATVLAAQIRFAHPDADIQLMTYGAPRSGDSRMYQLIAGIPQVNLAAVNDPVTALPPQGYELYPWFLVVPAPLYNQWAIVSRPTSVLILQADGTLTQGDPSLVTGGSVWSAIQAALAADPLPIYFTHLMGFYAAALKQVPPGP